MAIAKIRDLIIFILITVLVLLVQLAHPFRRPQHPELNRI